MNKIAISLLIAAACMSGCKKKENNNEQVTKKYYFKYVFNESRMLTTSDEPSYAIPAANELAGTQRSAWVVAEMVDLKLYWPVNYTITDADIMQLKGRTLSYRDTSIKPTLTIVNPTLAKQWNALDTAYSAYFVSISDVSLLGRDTIVGVPLVTYVIKGITNTMMYNSDNERKELTEGEFNIVMARRDL